MQKCHQCKKEFLIGDSKRAERLPEGVRFFHVDCYIRFEEDDKAIDEAFRILDERQKRLFD